LIQSSQHNKAETTTGQANPRDQTKEAFIISYTKKNAARGRAAKDSLDDEENLKGREPFPHSLSLKPVQVRGSRDP
jgi:hypothetical protein